MVVVTGNIQDGAGLAVDAELEPGDNFAEFFPASETAGKEEEGVGEVGHHGFALMHGFNDVQLGERWMSDFLLYQRAGHDTDGLASGGQHGVREDAHQADAAAAEDQGYLGIGEGAT